MVGRPPTLARIAGLVALAAAGGARCGAAAASTAVGVRQQRLQAACSAKEAANFLAEVAPPLDGWSHKGQGGRLGILGGSEDFTGAPFYAGLAGLRTGAELVWVFCAEEAAVPIKAYSPELMVKPVFSANNPDRFKPALGLLPEMLPRLHALVIGCGLGRNDDVLHAAQRIITGAQELRLPLVIDADGIQAVRQDPSIMKGCTTAVLTPNVNEYRQLLDAVGLGREETPTEEGTPTEEQLLALCTALDGPVVCLKGPTDLVASADGVRTCAEPGSPRRSGGLGDVLAGIMGAILCWAARPGLEQGTAAIASAALTACVLNRRSCRAAFRRRRRAMTAPDVLEEIGGVFEELSPAEGPGRAEPGGAV